MSESGQIVLSLCILIAVYILTRKVHAWRIKRAYLFIIKDLENRGAFDPSSAVTLPYVKVGGFRVGVRDYRPKALEYLVSNDIVRMAPQNRYYLKDKEASRLLWISHSVRR